MIMDNLREYFFGAQRPSEKSETLILSERAVRRRSVRVERECNTLVFAPARVGRD